MHQIMRADYRHVSGLSDRAVDHRLNGIRGVHTRGRFKEFALADVIPTLKAKERNGAVELLSVARNSGNEWAGGMASLPQSQKLETWLTTHVEGAAFRLQRVRDTFFFSLTRSLRTSGLLGDAEGLRLHILRSPAILPYVLTGNEAGLPGNWPAWASRFALINSGRSPCSFHLLGEVAA